MGRFINLLGQKFNKLTVIERATDYISPKGYRETRWLCECECGNKKIVFSKDLKKGRVKSCGCLCHLKKKKTRLIDFTGKRFGILTVIERAPNIVNPNGHNVTAWKCKCDCGNEKIIRAPCLKNGSTISCGCISKQKSLKRAINRRRNIENERFCMLTAVKRIGSDPKTKSSLWLCKCDCGNEKIVRAGDLISGRTKSCGCWRNKQLSEIRCEDISGNKYQLLKAIKPVGRDKWQNVLWECICDCGNTTYASVSELKKGNKKSCGCLHSIMEAKTEEYLSTWNVRHKWHHRPSDLRTSHGGFCEFDFLILYNCNSFAYIECQGMQHYRDDSSFGKQQREETDELKREYCRKKKIPLFEIRYDEDIEVKLKEILDTLHVNPVPDAAQSAA